VIAISYLNQRLAATRAVYWFKNSITAQRFAPTPGVALHQVGSDSRRLRSTMAGAPIFAP
jgi:hypothetical protein